MTNVGHVAGIWRYPVKSMQGEALPEVEVGEKGLLGDRAFAIVEVETGHIATAKFPQKWGKLLDCRAAYREPPQPGRPLPPVDIALPDGRTAASDDPEADLILSDWLGRTVRLTTEVPAKRTRQHTRLDPRQPEEGASQAEPMVPAANGTFFDYGAVHLLTTGTLDRLQRLQPESRFDPRRFRPNILIATPEAAGHFPENAWLGQTLQIGPDLKLRLIDPCPRCIITTLPQGDLPADRMILRALAQHNPAASLTMVPGHVFPAVAGAYGKIERSGLTSVGAATVICHPAIRTGHQDPGLA